MSNQTWTNLLKDFKFYDDDIDDHILFLRRKFVTGAAEMMAGKKILNKMINYSLDIQMKSGNSFG